MFLVDLFRAKMKVLLCFVLLGVIFEISAYGSHLIFDKKHEILALECITGLEVDVEEIYSIRGQEVIAEDDPKYFHFAECFWKNLGVFKDDGDWNLELLNHLLVDSIRMSNWEGKYHKQVASMVADTCRKVDGPSVGIKAIRMENCLNKNLIKYLKKYNV